MFGSGEESVVPSLRYLVIGYKGNTLKLMSMPEISYWLKETSSSAPSAFWFRLSPTLQVIALSTNLHHWIKKQCKIFSSRLPVDTKTLALTLQNYHTVQTAWSSLFMKGVADMVVCILQVFYMQKFMTVLKHPDSSCFLLNSNLPDICYISYSKGYLTLVAFL